VGPMYEDVPVDQLARMFPGVDPGLLSRIKYLAGCDDLDLQLRHLVDSWRVCAGE
jgi:hypothetical protein